MPEFAWDVTTREAEKAKELAPYIKDALGRKEFMKEMEPSEVPVVKASVKSAKVGALGDRGQKKAS